MKSKRNPLTIPVILTLILMFATAATLSMLSHWYSVGDMAIVTAWADDLQMRLDEDGLEQSKAKLDEAAQHLGDAGNAVVVDAQGAILYSTNKLHIEGLDKIRLMVSATAKYRKEWEYEANGSSIRQSAIMCLALFVDEAGGILKPVCALDTESEQGTQWPRYKEYFPSWLRDDSNYDAWSVDEPESIPLYAQNYNNWESKLYQEAGISRLTQRPLQDGGNLLLLYNSDDALHAVSIREFNLQNRKNWLYMAFLTLTCVFILLLAWWVFVDAKRREFKPALWGVLTLIGNVVAWIIYMMVRPEIRPARACPRCGIVLKQAYAFCPDCGQPLLNKCAQCGRALDEAFRFCPDCGAAASAPASNAPEAPAE